MVVGDLRQFVVAQEICPGVTDVHQGHLAAEPVEPGDSGAHAGEVGIIGDHVGDAVAHIRHCIGKRVQDVFRLGRVDIQIGDERDRDGTGEFASGMATHAVGHQQQRWPGIAGILVSLSYESDVRPGRVAKRE